MRILITGICGFAGSALAVALAESEAGLDLFGVDNFMRPGSEVNRLRLQRLGARVWHADLRVAADLESWPKVDFVVDAAANPTVLAGLANNSSSRQLIQHNLLATTNLLEFCKAHSAGFLLLSTSRVYSVLLLANLKLEVHEGAFRVASDQRMPLGFSSDGLTEDFPTQPPVSLYGATKICSETLAIEYGLTFGFPVWVNRLGVLAGAGQFGRADQGIFSFWIHSYARRRPLKFIGFGGQGFQVRDCLHPRDLASVIRRQIRSAPLPGEVVTNFGGGVANSMSLRQLHTWCENRFGQHSVANNTDTRPFDVPWLVLDASRAKERFNWKPATGLPAILEEIATHAEANPDWLDRTSG